MYVERSGLLLFDHQSSLFQTAKGSLRRSFAARFPQILIYSILLLPISLSPCALGFGSLLFGTVAVSCGAIFVAFASQLHREPIGVPPATLRVLHFLLVRALRGAFSKQPRHSRVICAPGARRVEFHLIITRRNA
jgi:hypothetical protein